LGGTRELRKIFIEKIPILQVSDVTNFEFEKLVQNVQEGKKHQLVTKDIEIEIDNRIFDLYNITNEEKNAIGYIEIR
jgi:hypothetical protein